MRNKLLELLEPSGNLELEAIMMRMISASIIACVIYFSYWCSHAGGIYSKKFNITLVTMTLVTTMVMIVIGNNLALSLGMVGALSIIRFRTAIKDSRDAVYIFWALVVGICCGAGDYQVASVGTIFVMAALLVFGRIKNDNRVLLVIRTSRSNEERLEALLFQRFARKASLRVKNSTENSVEFIYEVSRRILDRDNRNAQSLTDAVYSLGNIEYFNVVAQNDDIGS